MSGRPSAWRYRTSIDEAGCGTTTARRTRISRSECGIFDRIGLQIGGQLHAQFEGGAAGSKMRAHRGPERVGILACVDLDCGKPIKQILGGEEADHGDMVAPAHRRLAEIAFGERVQWECPKKEGVFDSRPTASSPASETCDTFDMAFLTLSANDGAFETPARSAPPGTSSHSS